MIFQRQLPDGTLLENILPPVLVDCMHLGSQRKCCVDLWICRHDRSACIPNVNHHGPVGTSVRLCRGCEWQTPCEAQATQ
jgi:hypothetical protein